MSNHDAAGHQTDEIDDESDDAHLEDIEDGAGCTEIWERLSETRREQ